MSVYTNQTNASPGDAFFAAAGSGGGGGTPSNWSSYPALTTITYSGAGGVANFTEVYSAIGMSTPQLFASTIVGNDVYAINTMSAIEIQADNLFVSSINSAAYPPAAGITPLIGILPIPETATAFETDTIAGVTSNSIITGTLTASSNVGIQTLTAQTDKFYMALTDAAPSGCRFYYVIWPNSNSTPTPTVFSPPPGYPGYPGFPY